MKKFLTIATAMILSVSLVACGGKSGTGLKDGTYTKEAADFDDKSWKSSSTITVSGGKIIAANWDAINETGATKKDQSVSGEYGMVEKGGSQSEWHEQVKLVEDKLIETQDPAQLDEISGVSIDTTEFKILSIEALNEAK